MDITDKKTAEEEKISIEMRIAQSRMMDALGTLAGGIAHDFNNILSAIIGFTELAIHEIDNKDKVKASLNEVLASGEKARELVKQILTFSRMNESEYKSIKLEQAMKDSLKMLRAVIPPDIEIKHNLNASGYVLSNSTQLSQIMFNLCSNAAQSMETTGGTIEITLDEIFVNEKNNTQAINVPEGNYLRITISDTGKGMPHEMRERIFEPYFINKDGGIGSGLDLSFIYGIVKSHNGDIICRGNNNGGTTFEVILPKNEKAEKNIILQAENELETGNGRILLIDDDPILVKLLVEMLEIMGYEVVPCISSSEGLQIFKRTPENFNLVITDMTMPEMNGDRLSREIISIRNNIPIILCTGFNEQISEAQAKEIGIREFIMKPVNMRTLSSVIHRAMDNE